MKYLFTLLLTMLLSTHNAQANDETINIKEILKLDTIVLEPVIDYCNTKSPRSKDALSKGMKNLSEQYNLAITEWINSNGDSNLTGSKKDFDEAVDYFHGLSSKLMDQIHQVEPTSYCNNLADKLLKADKNSLNAQYIDLWNGILAKEKRK